MAKCFSRLFYIQRVIIAPKNESKVYHQKNNSNISHIISMKILFKNSNSQWYWSAVPYCDFDKLLFYLVKIVRNEHNYRI